MRFLDPIFILSILIALSVHEWAHGFAAFKLGDPTAKYAGRLTLNPIAHLDLLGSFLFLLVGFGWGKPVPIDPRYFRHVKRDTAITAIAGPASNLILASLAFVGLVILAPLALRGFPDVFSLLEPESVSVTTQFFLRFFGSSLFLNLGLMAFNLLPIAPLDGSKVLGAFIPPRYESSYEDLMRRGPFILLFLLIAERVLNFPLLTLWVFGIMGTVLRGMSAVMGVFG